MVAVDPFAHRIDLMVFEDEELNIFTRTGQAKSTTLNYSVDPLPLNLGEFLKARLPAEFDPTSKLKDQIPSVIKIISNMQLLLGAGFGDIVHHLPLLALKRQLS